jgi:methionyl-tRNA formyltransferase
MLEAHPEIEFLGGFCQSEGQTFAARVKDLWRRRGVLGLPVLAIEAATGLGRYVAHPRSEIRLRKQTARIADRIALVPDIHAAKVRARVRALEPDLGLIYGGPIMRPELFEIPPLGTLGIHHGKVPEYRGKKTTFWAMYNGESAVGVTIQRVNAGIDTGEVVKAGDVLTAGKSYRKVWQELEALGLALYLEAILEMKRGKATFRPQGGKKGKLYKDPKIGDLLSFWWRRL